MKKYLLLIEDEKLWGRFKEIIEKDINSELIELVKEIRSLSRKSASDVRTESSRRGICAALLLLIFFLHF